MNEECIICLEQNCTEDCFSCDTCKNVFHNSCIVKIKNKLCPICRCSIKKKYNNYTFNNMDLNRNFDIDYYINKWNNRKCINSNHLFELETLGEWNVNNNTWDLIFEYKYMHIKCVNCEKNIIVK